MVAVFNKELLSWYLITLKLKETVESGTPDLQTPSTTRSIELPERRQKVQKQQQQPSNPLQIVINGETDEKFEEGPKLPESEWVICIEEKLEQARQEELAGSWAKLCIYRVPRCLRDRDDKDDKAYIPQTVSLGPYHHGKKPLREIDNHKWRSLYHVLERNNQNIQLYLDSIKQVEERTRTCYEGPINLTSNEFVEMMVLDGCFILELFQGVAEGFTKLGYCRNDPIFAMRGTMHSIQRDMVMLENQIPLFILDRLLRLQSGQNNNQRGRLENLALLFFDPLMPTDEPLRTSHRRQFEPLFGHINTFDPLSEQGSLHCLDVFRRSLLRRGPIPEPRIWIRQRSNASRVADKRRQQLIHCVTELREAGIRFKKRKTDRFWDIKFKNGILELPRLLIHDGTKSLFLNLIAFEQCHLSCSNDITSYVIFMDNLIDSAEDVGYLHYCGIIEHWLGSDAEVADLFNRICQEVVFGINDSYLSGLSDQITRYYNYRWNAWHASLKHNYFNNPWAIISFIAAVVLLLLTFGQTFFGVYGYYKSFT